MTTTQRWWVIANPMARRSAERTAAVVAALRARGVADVTVRRTTRVDAGRGQAHAAVVAGATDVVVIGGDGTVREVAGPLAGTGVRLGVVPAGSANVLAYNLRLPAGRAGVATALAGAVRPVDAATASWRDPDGTACTATFLVMAGLGHDARTVARTRAVAKARLGWAAYFAAGATTALLRPAPVRVTADTGVWQGSAWTVLIGSCPLVPPGVRVFPHVRPDDGLLEVARVEVARPWQWLPLAAKGIARLDRDVPRLSYQPARVVEVVPAAETPLALDGDLVGLATSLRCEVRPGALLLRVPPVLG